jgi:hypothetical protein
MISGVVFISQQNPITYESDVSYAHMFKYLHVLIQFTGELFDLWFVSTCEL